MNLIKINSKNADLRLDKLLCQEFNISFPIAQKLIRQKKIKVNNQKPQPSLKLSINDEVQIFINLEKRVATERKKAKISPEKIKFFKKQIIFEDQNIIIINKPSGLATQGGSKTSISVNDFLPHLKQDNQQNPKLVHRLDKDTSGILIIAKNKEISQIFFDKFKNKQIKKTYLALVAGEVKQEAGQINIPLIKKVKNGIEKVYKDEINGKNATTNFKILKKFKNQTLLELNPITGRTHQLRVHCKEIGHPIINDIKYGGKKVKSKSFSNLCLHALKIEIANYFDKNLKIETKIPNFSDIKN